jgi:succinoglycan biosynthesis transport protein ExoP
MEALTGKRIRPLTILSQEWQKTEPNPPDDAVQTLKQVLDSIRRYRPFILRMIVVGALLAGLGSLFMSPSYMATAQLAVNARSAGAADAPGPAGNPPAATGGSEDSTIDTHVTVLLSDAYLRRLLPTLRTLDGAGHDTAAESATWTMRAWTLFRAAWSKTKKLLFISQRQPSDGMAVAALKGRLKVSQERRSRIISVIFTDRDPKRAAEVANLVARSYVDELIRQKQAVETQALDAIAVQSAAIQRDLSKAKAELDASRPGQASPSQSAALEWQMTTLSQQYETLLRRRQELTTKGVVTEPEVTLIADASPPDFPSSLNPFLLVPPVTIAFALFACLLAVILHRFDRTLHTEAEAAEALRIPCAGLIPSIPLELSKQPRRILEQPAIAYTRAIRSTVVSLLASDQVAPRSQRIVLVTSSIRGEGKSAISWSFGFYAAQLGQRVLFLDFGQLSRRPGGDSADLFRVLAHDHPLADAIQHIQELGIDYLSAGLSDGNRLWLLANPKMSLLFEQLRDTYDLVVIDAPSMQDAPEVRLLARWADHVLLAVRAGSTNRDLAQSTLHQFARTEDIDANTQFWSVLTRKYPSEPEPSEMGQSPEPTLMMRYRWLKAAVARWMRIEPVIDVSDSAQPNLRSHN